MANRRCPRSQLHAVMRWGLLALLVLFVYWDNTALRTDSLTYADVAAIDTAIAELNAAWQAASQDIYAQQQAQGGANANANANAGAGASGAEAGAGAGSAAGDSSQPEDVEFEEVK